MSRTRRPDPRTAIVNAGKACEAWLRQIPKLRERGNFLAAELARHEAATWSRIAFQRAAKL